MGGYLGGIHVLKKIKDANMGWSWLAEFINLITTMKTSSMEIVILNPLVRFFDTIVRK
jgi:hypothetical protein